jgi:hypothetical protein
MKSCFGGYEEAGTGEKIQDVAYHQSKKVATGTVKKKNEGEGGLLAR